MILFFIKVLYLCKQKLKPKTMTRIILFTMIFLLGLSSAQAQNKSERIKEIRKMYAEAKAQIANNGKDGNPAKDMKIAFNEIVSIEHDIYNEGSLDIYFDEQRKVNVSDGSFNAYEQPYFISYYNTIHGHECFREQMFDRKTGVLAFAFVRWITDAGMTIEHRYYYDAAGKLIETKNSTESDDWGTGDSEKKLAELYHQIFKLAIEDAATAPAVKFQGTQRSKADQLKHIRTQYARAKDKSGKKVETFYPCDVTITIHNQEEGDCPPVTDVICLFGEKSNNDATSDTKCFLATTHRTTMSFDNYHEFLYDPATYHLIFSYDRGAEEGEVREWRYYFNELGTCIERKSNAEEIGDDSSEKNDAYALQSLFQLLVKNW